MNSSMSSDRQAGCCASPSTAFPAKPTRQAIMIVTVEDCEAVTRQLQYVLEVGNVDYARLEVSSPGLDRPLKRVEDYARFAGQQVLITLKMPFQGRKKYQGQLRRTARFGLATGLQRRQGRSGARLCV